MDFILNFWFIAVALFALGFSIFIHELGHFLAARRRGLVADRFSIGFGPRIFGWTHKGTDYRISLLPFGGYVSLPQLADMGRLEGGEGDEAERLPPISYADKVIVAVMGAVFNIIFAFMLSLVLWGVGQNIMKSTEIDFVAPEVVSASGEVVPGPAYEAGIRPGDTIIAVDGYRIRDWMQFNNAIMTGIGREPSGRPVAQIEVLRGEELKQFTVHPILMKAGIDEIRTIGVDPGTDLVVLSVQKDMPAYDAGLLPGDVLLALDGQPIVSSAFLSVYLQNYTEGLINLSVLRNGAEVTLPIQPRIARDEQSPRFGFSYNYDAKTVHVHRDPVEQMGIMVHTMKSTLIALFHKGSDVKPSNMSGPVGIVHGLTRMAQIGWIDLIWLLALINVNLAILNLMPIPVLDGGHILFATISKIIRRPLPRKLMENVQFAFVLMLLGFVVYVSFFDVQRVGWDMGLMNDSPATPAPAEVEEPGN